MKIILLTVLASLATPAAAEQVPYRELARYTIYQEAESCVMYADFEDGTMLRMNNRTADQRLNFSAYNANWQSLSQHQNETIMTAIGFGNLSYGSAGTVTKLPDGRLGWGAGDYANGEVLDSMAKGSSMKLTVTIGGENIDHTYPLDGSQQAVAALRACSSRYFGDGR